jgi:Tfp pilus assembly protein PilF
MKSSALFIASLFFAVRLPAAVTFAHDIAPIVYRECALCHRPGESGPFPLLTYDDVKKHARQIADVTKRRFMPPWLPDPGPPFQDELRLTDEQIRLFAAWAEAGAPEGDASEIPQPPKFTEGWQLGPPDLILDATKPFTVPASGPDAYWNFIFPVNVDSRKWVRAIEIRPGNPRVFHHANLYIDRSRSARLKSGGNGFPGMDVVIERPIREPDDGHFLYWKPGGIPFSEPDGFAWPLDPGIDLVLNSHMLPSGKPEEIRPQVGLYFTDKPQSHFPMLLQLEHDGTLNIPPGARDYIISDDFELPMDVDVLAIYPHAHYLGHLLEAYATLPSGCRKSLIHIRDWDRNWEAVYRYSKPEFLPKGTIVSMRFHYDNSAANPRNPNNPPKRVRAGNTASDEMGHLWLQVLPRGRGDRRMELEEAVLHHELEKYPNDPEAHMHLGAIKLSRFDPSGAAAELEIAAKALPENPEAHNMLGSAFLALGRIPDATAQFRIAVTQRPDYPTAKINLALALVKSGKYDEAIGIFRGIVDQFPNDAIAHNSFGEILFRAGKYDQALEQFDQAIALDSTLDVAKQNRDYALKELHK